MQWRQQMEAIRNALPGQLGVVFADQVEPEKIFGEEGSRDRIYTAAVTFWAMLGQVLRGGALRDGVAEVRASHRGSDSTLPSAKTGSYSDARARLPLEAITQVHERVLAKMIAPSTLLEGRRILAVDATSVQLADTSANQASFPQPSNQAQGCGFPVMQVVALFDLDTSAMVKLAHSPLRVDEAGLFQVELMNRLKENDILLGDRYYGTYYHIAKLQAQSADGLFRLHGSRHWPKGTKGDDVIVQWSRPPFGRSETISKNCRSGPIVHSISPSFSRYDPRDSRFTPANNDSETNVSSSTKRSRHGLSCPSSSSGMNVQLEDSRPPTEAIGMHKMKS